MVYANMGDSDQLSQTRRLIRILQDSIDAEKSKFTKRSFVILGVSGGRSKSRRTGMPLASLSRFPAQQW